MASPVQHIQKMERPMNIQTKKEANVTVATITGRLDAVTTSEYEKRINELIAQGEIAFILDFGGLDYISSAGLRGLLTTAKQLKAKGGQVRFANVKGAVKEVFDISGFGTIFPMDDSVAASLATFS
ncbi:STAS domain-containing protein [Desulfurivibrio sp. C05AmB]|uniref:STAS domain-containing protein n=1 Tax=Desulfurivibrio sp. C05AmB TaxID=3374371 RepID=UPI00376ED5F9